MYSIHDTVYIEKGSGDSLASHYILRPETRPLPNQSPTGSVSVVQCIGGAVCCVLGEEDGEV